jgi:hypothetical protein
MVFKTLLLIIVISILMEDSASIRKTEEEKREDEEVQRAVNATLAAEEEKRRKEDEDEAKKKKEVKKESQGKKEDVESQDEACPPVNVSCPIVEPCPPCPEVKECEACKSSKDCPPVKECGPCEICKECGPCKICKECGPCPKVKPCQPCGPNPVVNHTETTPSACHCSEEDMGMTVPVALLVGTCAGGLLTGVAAVLGLVIRYFSPLECGFLFLATIFMVWYFSSQYPETARELGGRAATLLREAAVALSQRVMAAIQRHQEQVSIPINLSLVSSLE